MSSIKIYRYDEDQDTYNQVAELYDDGKVTGESGLSRNIENIVERFNAQGATISEYWPEVRQAIIRRYNTGYMMTADG